MQIAPLIRNTCRRYLLATVVVCFGGVASGQGPTINTPSPPPNGEVTVLYPTQTLTATDTTPLATCCDWAVTQGALPGGLTLARDSSGNGIISGTPNAAGTFSFEVTATDSLALSSSPQALTITIKPA